MKRRFFILCIIIIALVIPETISAQSTDRERHTFEDWEFITNTTGLTLMSYLGREADLEIPAEIYGISVTGISDELFKNSSFLNSVTIPDSVTAIGRGAFQGCSSLTEIRLPKNLNRIDPNTFRYCTSLERIDLPETVASIGAYSFSGCIKLLEIIIPDSVTSIGESAFDDCMSLENITVSRNLNSLEGNAFRNTPWLTRKNEEGPVLIGNTILLKWNGTDSLINIPYGVTLITDAFAGNTYAESIIIPSTVTRIGPNAFRDAVNLRYVSIPDSVIRIDSSAFQGNRSLRSISLPDGITAMGASVFSGCEKLIRIELPAELTSISSNLLANCSSLTDVTIPSGVRSIHTTAFSGSQNVRLHVTFDSEGERFAQENNLPYTYYLQQTKDFIYSKNEDGIQILKYIGNLYDVEIPSKIGGLPVNRVNTAAFQNNGIARNIVIPDTVKTIGDWAFSYMDSLESVRMSSGLVSLGADAFTGSAGLKAIALPDSIGFIGVEPFEGIENLTICTVSGSLTEKLLTEMGYTVSDGDACITDGFHTDPVITADAADVQEPARTPEPAVIETEPDVTAEPTAAPTLPTAEPPVSVLVFPEECTEVTAEMLENTTEELTLVIPAGVKRISEDILSGHKLTIVGDSGTEAESFARKWDLKFLLRTWYELDYGGSEITE